MARAPPPQGFDDLFDDNGFQAARRIMTPAFRPKMWPRGVTKMRANTNYGSQGLSQSTLESAQYKYVTSRPVDRLAQLGKKIGQTLSLRISTAPVTRLQQARENAMHRLQKARDMRNARRMAAARKPTAPMTDSRRWSWSDGNAK